MLCAQHLCVVRRGDKSWHSDPNGGSLRVSTPQAVNDSACCSVGPAQCRGSNALGRVRPERVQDTRLYELAGSSPMASHAPLALEGNAFFFEPLV